MSKLEEAREIFSKDLYATKQSGIQIEEVGDHYSKCSMPITENHRNAYGGIMGGSIYTLADFAFAVASNFEQENLTVSLVGQASFLNMSKGSILYAEAKLIKDGRTNCFYEISIYDDLGKDVAVVSFTGAHVNKPMAKLGERTHEMRELFSLDQHDYKEDGKVFRRDSVRGIILKDGKVLLVHSKKYGYYKFPGGGIEGGEDHSQTLCREVREETGFEVCEESIQEFGLVPRRHKDARDENGIFAQDNYYYFCELREGAKSEVMLDDYEREEGFTPVWMEPFEASQRNRYCDLSQEGLDAIMVKREAKVLDLVDLESRKLQRKEHERNTLKALGRPEYFEMLDYVREMLEENNTERDGSGKLEIAYSRFDHTKRVLAWVLRLYEKSSRKNEILLDELVIATIFHDVGRKAADKLRIPHAQAGVPITREYLEKKGYDAVKIDYVCSLVEQHSDKYRMKKEKLDPGLLMLMEADLLDDMGAQGIVMDCMITESRNPNARFEDCLDHVTRYTLRQQEEDNPMVSPEGIAFWDEKTKLTRYFVESLRKDVGL